jgi:hypothetical protein
MLFVWCPRPPPSLSKSKKIFLSSGTGRQRVMTASEQDMDDESAISIAKFYRVVQLADYEASYAMYTGAFSLFGCLPVLPGPCVMIRYRSLLQSTRLKGVVNTSMELQQQLKTAQKQPLHKTESPLAHFIDVVSTPISEVKILLLSIINYLSSIIKSSINHQSINHHQ